MKTRTVVFFLALVALTRANESLDVEVVTSNERTGRGRHSADLLHHFFDKISTRLNFAAEQLGIIECKGADGVTGGDLFSKYILGQHGADFGGDYLCQPTCGGSCVPNKAINAAPVSLYPFGCQCSQARCGPAGPIIMPLARPSLKVVCVQDNNCTCSGMNRYGFEPGSPQHAYAPRDVGYLCNWINKVNNIVVSYSTSIPDSSVNIHPKYSPIRWCSCCPKVSVPY